MLATLRVALVPRLRAPVDRADSGGTATQRRLYSGGSIIREGPGGRGICCFPTTYSPKTQRADTRFTITGWDWVYANETQKCEVALDNYYANCVHNSMWGANDIAITLHSDMTDDPIVTAEISTPDGIVMVMAEVYVEDRNGSREMMLKEFHIHGEDIGSGEFGTHRLIRLAKAVMEAMNVNEMVVHGARRTTGANPGHRPRPLRLSRKNPPTHQALRSTEHSEGGVGAGEAPSDNEESPDRTRTLGV